MVGNAVHMTEKKMLSRFWLENLKERDQEDLGVEGRILK